jgi:hypothetical protein
MPEKGSRRLSEKFSDFLPLPKKWGVNRQTLPGWGFAMPVGTVRGFEIADPTMPPDRT